MPQSGLEPQRQSPDVEPQALASEVSQLQQPAPPVPHWGKVGLETQWPLPPPSQQPDGQFPLPQVQEPGLPVQAWSAAQAPPGPQAQVPVVAPQPLAVPAVWAAWQLQHVAPPAPHVGNVGDVTHEVEVAQHPVGQPVGSQTQPPLPMQWSPAVHKVVLP